MNSYLKRAASDPIDREISIDFNAAFEAMPGNSIFVEVDSKFTILSATESYTKTTGVARSALIGKGVFEAFPPNTNNPHDTAANDLRASFEKVITYKKAHQLPVQRYDVLNEEGIFVERFWRISNSPVLDKKGGVAYIINTAEEITQEVKAQQQKERITLLEKAHNLFLQAPVAIQILKGPELVIELANKPTLELWNRQPDIIGKHLVEVLPELKEQGYIDYMKEVIQTGLSKEFYETPIILKKRGKEKVGYFNFVYQPYYEEDRTKAVGLLVFATDVTERVTTKKELALKQQKLDLAIEIGAFGLFNIDLSNTDLLSNSSTCSQQIMDWFGFTDPHLPLSKFFSKIHPNDYAVVVETMERCLAKEWAGRHDIIYRITNSDNGTVQYLRSIGQVQFEADVPKSIIGIIQDVTEQVLARQQLEEAVELRTQELAKANQALIRTNEALSCSNNNLSRFAYAAAHDLKEPIRKIQIFGNLLKTSLANRMTEAEGLSLNRMDAAAKRMNSLIENLLAFSEVSVRPNEFEEVNLNDLMALVLENLDLEIEEKGAKVKIDKLCTLQGHHWQLEQAFQNLISNALKYSKTGIEPQITITCNTVKGINIDLQLSQVEQGQEFTMICVSDNGIGFEQKDAELIFNVFTRLHDNTEFKGSGVGLSIVRKVIENHNGYITVQSKPGEGSTFRIYLPVTCCA